MKDKKLEDISLSLNLSRYTFLRYMTSIEFFIFLYWIISSLLSKKYLSMIIPLLLAGLMVVINKDIFIQIKNIKQSKIEKIVLLLKISLAIMVVCLLISLLNHKLLFPYIDSKTFVLVYIIVSILILALSTNNALKIRDKKDKIYKRYEEYRKKNKNEERIKYV